MSYAQAATSGPKQSPEDARAPPVPEIEHTDDSVHSLIDVDSPHISSVPSDYETQSVKTDTQAERLEHEAEARERQAEETASKTKAKASTTKDKAKAKVGKGAGKIRENADNPVVVGNAITVGLLGTALGAGAYRKYIAGELTWKVVGAWAGVVGLFAVGDYYISQYLFKKYPPKN